MTAAGNFSLSSTMRLRATGSGLDGGCLDPGGAENDPGSLLPALEAAFTISQRMLALTLQRMNRPRMLNWCSRA